MNLFCRSNLYHLDVIGYNSSFCFSFLDFINHKNSYSRTRVPYFNFGSAKDIRIFVRFIIFFLCNNKYRLRLILSSWGSYFKSCKKATKKSRRCKRHLSWYSDLPEVASLAFLTIFLGKRWSENRTLSRRKEGSSMTMTIKTLQMQLIPMPKWAVLLSLSLSNQMWVLFSRMEEKLDWLIWQGLARIGRKSR